MADNDKKFLDEDGVSQFAEETKKYIDKHADNADIHVNADDKAKIADVVNKANDADVVHKTGDETIAGNKTFTDKTTGTLFSGNFECNNKTSYYGTDYFYALSINDGKTHITNISNDTENRLILSVLSDNEKAGNIVTLGIPRDAATASDTSGFYLQWIGKLRNNVTPQRDNAFSLGLPDFRWETLYVNKINGKDIAYASDIPDVSGLAVDSNVVHKTGDETVAGIKTFTSSTIIDGSGKFYQAYASGYIKGSVPTSAMYQGIRFYDDQKTSTVANHITGAFEIQYNTDGYNKAYVGCRNYSGTSQLNYNVGLRVPNDATKSVDFFPSTDNKINLGTVNYKWADTNTVLLNGKVPAYASDLNDVSYMSRNETINGLKTFVNPLTVTRPNVGTTGYVIKLTFKRGEEISAVNHSTFRVTDSENIIVSEVCTENYTDGKVAQILNVRNTNAAGAQIQSSISHLLDKTGDQDWFYSVRDGQTYLGTSSYRWADVNTVLLNGKTPAYADDLSPYALDAGVVHTKGAEEIGGTKTFTGTVVHKDSTQKIKMENTAVDYDVPLTSTKAASVEFYDKNNKNMARLILQRDTNGRNSFGLTTYNRNDSGSELSRKVALYLEKDYSSYFSPNVNNQVDLGHSSYHWKNVYTNLVNGKTPDLIEEQGDGYIRYSNGIQICWDNVLLHNLVQSAGYSYACNFPKSFIAAPSVTVNYSSAYSTDTGIAAESIGTAGCTIWVKNTKLSVADFNINYMAIGKWK